MYLVQAEAKLREGRKNPSNIREIGENRSLSELQTVKSCLCCTKHTTFRNVSTDLILYTVLQERETTAVNLVYELCCRVKVGYLPRKLSQTMITSAWSGEMRDLNFFREFDYTEFSWFASVPPNKVPVRPRPRTSTSLPIHYLPVALPIDTTPCAQLDHINKSPT